MNAKQMTLTAVLVAFLGLTAHALYYHGLVALFAYHFANTMGMQVFFDLVIALTLFLVWMVRDARQQGIAAPPYVAATLGLGSIGALLYLLHREHVLASRG